MYLVDGNNLIGHTKGISLKSGNCRQQLIDRLIPFLDRKRRRALVFFDGAGEGLRKSHRIQIEFSGRKLSADEQIRRKVAQSTAPKNLCVVSSDNWVYGYGRSCGSKALRCHEFNRLLHDLGDTESDSNDGVPPEDMKGWLRYFGEEDD
jgi:predicted RNA-binding protein with PIN domain